MKYVIKNCDCYGFGDACLSNNSERLYCKDIPDCLLKRIAKTCGYASPDGGFNDSEAQDLASDILEMLNIEECENE